MLNRLRQYIELYGLKFTVLRFFKAVTSKLLRFSWDKCYLMSRTLDTPLVMPDRDDLTIRRICIDDMADEQWDSYMVGSRAFLQQCFESDYAEAYGAFVEGRLVYITWALRDKIDYGGRHIDAPGCAMHWNTFCLPQYRGRGIHNCVMPWVMNQMLQHGARKCCVSILSYNRPALKTQRKLGLTVLQTYYIIHWNHSTYYKGLDLDKVIER